MRIRKLFIQGVPYPGSASKGQSSLVLALATSTIFALLLSLSGCTASSSRRNSLAYTEQAFQAAIQERVPEAETRLTLPPYAVDSDAIERARREIRNAPLGPKRVEALVDFLSAPEPHGLGLSYDWSITSGANRTLETRRGNCFSLASVLVGLGRGLGWPIFYAEARPRHPESMEFEGITALSDHMVVLILAKSVRMIIDFSGEVEPDVYDIRPIDDVTAYAHLLNNIAGQSVLISEGQDREPSWENALEGFTLATRIQPELGRAWNNMGIAYARLGRHDEARAAYARALALDTAFGPAKRNLSLMETRRQGDPLVQPSGPNDANGLGRPIN